MKLTDYAPLNFVKRTNLANKTFSDRTNLGITVSPAPIEKQPGQHYALVRFCWQRSTEDPIECNLRILGSAS